MAGTGRIIASIYRYGNYQFPGVTGRMNNFPGNFVHMYPAPPNTPTVNGVTIQTIIQLLPSGLTTPADPDLKFYAADDVDTIQAAST